MTNVAGAESFRKLYDPDRWNSLASSRPVEKRATIAAKATRDRSRVGDTTLVPPGGAQLRKAHSNGRPATCRSPSWARPGRYRVGLARIPIAPRGLAANSMQQKNDGDIDGNAVGESAC